MIPQYNKNVNRLLKKYTIVICNIDYSVKYCYYENILQGGEFNDAV